jgi:hypothetical protein
MDRRFGKGNDLQLVERAEKQGSNAVSELSSREEKNLSSRPQTKIKEISVRERINNRTLRSSS